MSPYVCSRLSSQALTCNRSVAIIAGSRSCSRPPIFFLYQVPRIARRVCLRETPESYTARASLIPPPAKPIQVRTPSAPAGSTHAGSHLDPRGGPLRPRASQTDALRETVLRRDRGRPPSRCPGPEDRGAVLIRAHDCFRECKARSPAENGHLEASCECELEHVDKPLIAALLTAEFSIAYPRSVGSPGIDIFRPRQYG
jgi:hypothetical protein